MKATGSELNSDPIFLVGAGRYALMIGLDP